MARQKENKTSSELVLKAHIDRALYNWKQWRTAENVKDDPDQTKLGIWDAKIKYYEKQLEELPKRMAEAEKEDPERRYKIGLFREKQ